MLFGLLLLLLMMMVQSEMTDVVDHALAARVYHEYQLLLRSRRQVRKGSDVQPRFLEGRPWAVDLVGSL